MQTAAVYCSQHNVATTNCYVTR